MSFVMFVLESTSHYILESFQADDIAPFITSLINMKSIEAKKTQSKGRVAILEQKHLLVCVYWLQQIERPS